MFIQITKLKTYFCKGARPIENKWLGKQYNKGRRGKIKPYNFELKYLYIYI